MSPRKQAIKTSSALPSGGEGDCVEIDDTDEEVKEVMSLTVMQDLTVFFY